MAQLMMWSTAETLTPASVSFVYAPASEDLSGTSKATW